MTTSLLLALCAALPAEPAANTFAIHVEHAFMNDTGQRDDVLVVVVDGKIEAIGSPGEVEIPEGAPVSGHRGWLSAGLIACHTYSGAAGESDDSTRTMIPAAQMADAFRPDHLDFEDLLAAGITTVVLAPANTNLVGGQTTVVKSAGGRTLKERAHLAVSLSSDAMSTRRRPTSVSGGVAALRAKLDEGQGEFSDVLDLRLPLLIDVHDRHEVMRAIELCKEYKIGGVLYRAPLAGEIGDQLRSGRLGVIAEPLGPGHSQREIRALVDLAEIGTPLGFGLDAPEHGADALRFSAALCVRAGMEPIAAWRALTSDASRIAGVGKRVGRLDPGLDADLVLWSGHPLDLGSAVEAVYVDGERVLGGDE